MLQWIRKFPVLLLAVVYARSESRTHVQYEFLEGLLYTAQLNDPDLMGVRKCVTWMHLMSESNAAYRTWASHASNAIETHPE